MEITSRDIQFLTDLAYSHVLSRDQILRLAFFGSVSRVNARLLLLRNAGFVRALDTPFFRQRLYVVGPKAKHVLASGVRSLVVHRGTSPRFLQHALATANVRIALLDKGALSWLFEQQMMAQFTHQNRQFEVRPDGVAVTPAGLLAVEVDLGHVPLDKFKAKLNGYETFLSSHACREAWHASSFRLLVATPSARRASSLAALVSPQSPLELRCASFEELGATPIGSWS